MQYITYDEYINIGGQLDVTAFDRYSIRAFSMVNQETHGRIDKMAKVPDEVKHLCRDLIEYMHNNLNQDKSLSSISQSQGGVSEGEAYVYVKPSEHEARISEMIDDYLGSLKDDAGTPLLYRGAIG
jgi:hypothetical protein